MESPFGKAETTTRSCLVRPGRDSDASGIIDLIRRCWSDYPGIVFDVDGEMPELRSLATYYAAAGGALWVAEQRGQVVGMIAARPRATPSWEICRVYVLPGLHGAGLGHALLDVAEAHAIGCGAGRLMLWSDTRFDRAHRFYEKRSYVRNGPVRVLNDRSNSLEYAYAKPVDGIEVLDVAAAASAERRLAELLVSCVATGASISFLPPLSLDKALSFWREAARDIAVGGRVLLAGWKNGMLASTATLGLAMPENQRHRAEVRTVLVDPQRRRSGLGRAMMDAVEEAAAERGRKLLCLETKAGDAAEALFRSQGWLEYGRIPDHADDGTGQLCGTVFFYKRLG